MMPVAQRRSKNNKWLTFPNFKKFSKCVHPTVLKAWNLDDWGVFVCVSFPSISVIRQYLSTAFKLLENQNVQETETYLFFEFQFFVKTKQNTVSRNRKNH